MKVKRFLSNCTLLGCPGSKTDTQEEHFLRKKTTTWDSISAATTEIPSAEIYLPTIYHSQPALEEPKASYGQNQPPCFLIFLLLVRNFAALCES